MCSADYDGHRRTMGRTVGVRNADPNMKLVMGGIARPEIEYLKAMKLWADFHRGGDFPADVINLHHYSNDAGGQGGQPTTGISPEADGLRERFQRVVEWRDRFLPGKEVWVSEFGYDMNPQSTQRAPAIGAADAEEVQGRWIVRSYLALAAAGVDRAQLYMLRDVNAGNTVQYNSSGLTSEKWNQHKPKRAWYYVAALRHILRGTRFESEVPSGNANVRIYRFRSDGSAFARCLRRLVPDQQFDRSEGLPPCRSRRLRRHVDHPRAAKHHGTGNAAGRSRMARSLSTSASSLSS